MQDVITAITNMAFEQPGRRAQKAVGRRRKTLISRGVHLAW
jgi:hypothetical protein